MSSRFPHLILSGSILILVIVLLTILCHKHSTTESFITWFTPFLPDESDLLPLRLKHRMIERSHSHGTLGSTFSERKPLTISYPGAELTDFVKDLSIYLLSKTRTLNLRSTISPASPTGDFDIRPVLTAPPPSSSYRFVTTCFPRFLYIFGYKNRIETLWDMRDRKVAIEDHPMTRRMFAALKTDIENVTGEPMSIQQVPGSLDDLVADSVDLVVYTDTYPGTKYLRWFENHTMAAASVLLLDIPQELRRGRDVRSAIQYDPIDLNNFVNGYLPKQVDQTYYHQYRPTIYMCRSTYVITALDRIPAKTVSDFLTHMTPEFLIGSANRVQMSMRDLMFNSTSILNHAGTDQYMYRFGYQTENPAISCAFVMGTGLTCDPTLIRKIQDETF